MEKNTDTLTNILKSTAPDKIDNFLNSNEDELLTDNKPFAAYMRSLIREKGLLQQEVFANADISEGYGYKIISEEKHTRQRDTILRLCLGAKLTLEETQRALKIYGMSPLYPRVPRDAVLIVAINSRIYRIPEADALLIKSGEKSLRPVETSACAAEE